MKKQLTGSIIAVSMILSSTTSFAERLDTSDFFVKAHVSGNFFNNIKCKDDAGSVTAKSKTSPSIAFGFGYYVLDNFRADLTYEHYINPTFKYSLQDHEEYGSVKFNQKVDLSTLMLGGNVDIVELGVGKIFLGAGVGVAKHKTKYNVTGTDTEGDNFDIGFSTKVSNNFAYTVGAGVAFPIFDSVNAELAYSWRDFGSTKPKKNSDGENMTRKISYRSHNVSLGLRIDI
jgi:opacity protein-like surface antigen